MPRERRSREAAASVDDRPGLIRQLDMLHHAIRGAARLAALGDDEADSVIVEVTALLDLVDAEFERLLAQLDR